MSTTRSSRETSSRTWTLWGRTLSLALPLAAALAVACGVDSRPRPVVAAGSGGSAATAGRAAAGGKGGTGGKAAGAPPVGGEANGASGESGGADKGGRAAVGGAPSEEGGESSNGGASAGEAGDASLGGGGESGAPAGDECELFYTEGHGDVFVSVSDDETLDITIRSALEIGQPEALNDPSRVCIVVPVASYELASSYGGVPEGEDFAFIGLSPGENFWLLPEVATGGMPWFGASTEGISRGEYAEDKVELRLTHLDVPPGAFVATWFSGSFGSPTPMFSTADGLLATELRADSHLHFNWSFTASGVYRLTFEAEVHRARDGKTERHAEVLTFVVKS